MLYRKHIFICVNQRKEGERICCGEVHGMELVAAFKKIIKDKNISAEVRAQRTGCFDICETGPTVAVYPDGVFYGKVQISDVQEIFEDHIMNDKPVERLRLKFKRSV